MDKQEVIYKDLGMIGYKAAWDMQELTLQKNVAVKSHARINQPAADLMSLATHHYLLLCEHQPVYTLGKNGDESNVLLSEPALKKRGIEFFRINRGGDITFHGPGQIVGYPILDLEKIFTDIGKYLRLLEQVVIDTLAEYDLTGVRSKGETGVWLDPDLPGKARKICAIGVRCSRWITMHGFALNVNTDLTYFNDIIPCGIRGKQVTSLQKELGRLVDMEEVKQKLKYHFELAFNVRLVPAVSELIV